MKQEPPVACDGEDVSDLMNRKSTAYVRGGCWSSSGVPSPL